MADAVLTLCLEQTPCKLFFGTQVWLKNRGYVLAPDLGTVNNLIKVASNEEVMYMKKFRIVKVNIFEVWVITIRSHLEGRTMLKALRFYIQRTVRPITPQGKPQTRKLST